MEHQLQCGTVTGKLNSLSRVAGLFSSLETVSSTGLSVRMPHASLLRQSSIEGLSASDQAVTLSGEGKRLFRGK